MRIYIGPDLRQLDQARLEALQVADQNLRQAAGGLLRLPHPTTCPVLPLDQARAWGQAMGQVMVAQQVAAQDLNRQIEVGHNEIRWLQHENTRLRQALEALRADPCMARLQRMETAWTATTAQVRALEQQLGQVQLHGQQAQAAWQAERERLLAEIAALNQIVVEQQEKINEDYPA